MMMMMMMRVGRRGSLAVRCSRQWWWHRAALSSSSSPLDGEQLEFESSARERMRDGVAQQLEARRRAQRAKELEDKTRLARDVARVRITQGLNMHDLMSGAYDPEQPFDKEEVEERLGDDLDPSYLGDDDVMAQFDKPEKHGDTWYVGRYKLPKSVPFVLADPLRKKRSLTSGQQVDLPAYMTVRELAKALSMPLRIVAVKAHEAWPSWWPSSLTIKKLKKQNWAAMDDNIVSFVESAQLAARVGKRARYVDVEDWVTIQSQSEDDQDVQPRQSVVSILGHVDHGKTTLLDRLRRAHTAQHEPGGITQDVYSHQVSINGEPVTFLDTPGHEHFSEMRRNGAYFADLVVLMVAIDEGIQPQTVQSVEMAMEMGVPIVVCVNKTDLLDAADAAGAIERLSKQLRSELGIELVPSVDDVPQHVTDPTAPSDPMRTIAPLVHVSALHGSNVDALSNVVSDMLKRVDAHTDLAGTPYGAVIEAWTERGRGLAMRVILQQGVLRHGQHFAAGMAVGRIKGIRVIGGSGADSLVASKQPKRKQNAKQPSRRSKRKKNKGKGKQAPSSHQFAEPGQVVEVTFAGSDLPFPGSQFVVLDDQKQAQLLARTRDLETQYHEQPRIQDEEVDADAEDDVAAAAPHTSSSSSSSSSIRGRPKTMQAEFEAMVAKHRRQQALEQQQQQQQQQQQELDMAVDDDDDEVDAEMRADAVRDDVVYRALIKGNNIGSLDTVLLMLSEFEWCELVHAQVGSVTESDVARAAAFQERCEILCFRVPSISRHVRRKASEMNVRIRHFDVMYDLVDYLAERAEESSVMFADALSER